MNDFPFIWLLFNTKTGKIILGIIIAYLVIYIVGWWLLPIIAALIAAILLYDYYTKQRNRKELKCEDEYDLYLKNKRNKEGNTSLIIVICFLVLAIFLLLGLFNAESVKQLFSKEPDYHSPLFEMPSDYEEDKDSCAYVPDSVTTQESEKSKSSNSYPLSSSRSYNSSTFTEDYDNMRGFDPASEDDMDDNGMSRYMENDDDEGWD